MAGLVDLLNDYLRRFPNGAHAQQARSMLPEAERDRRQREFLRSDAIKDLRPRPEPVSDLERLYRKALLEQWLDGDDAARAIFEEIQQRDNVSPQDQFLLRLVEEDLLSLNLRRAERLRAAGENAEAVELLREIVDKYKSSLRHRRWVRTAQQMLAELAQ